MAGRSCEELYGWRSQVLRCNVLSKVMRLLRSSIGNPARARRAWGPSWISLAGYTPSGAGAEQGRCLFWSRLELPKSAVSRFSRFLGGVSRGRAGAWCGISAGGRARRFWLIRAPRPNRHSCPRAPVPERTSSFRVHEVGQKTLLRLGQNRLEIG